MKQFFTLLAVTGLFLVCPFLTKAQDYTIRLHSGNFTPEANIAAVSKSDQLFLQSQFDNRYYVVIQFSQLPSDAAKAQLKTAGVDLVDYIPNMAFTASVNGFINLESLRSGGLFSIRGIFRFAREQKTVPALLQGSFPAHAVRSPGTVDLSVITYEKMGPEKVRNEFGRLGITVLEDLPMFRGFTLRVPQQNAVQLVELPFIQWAEFVEPPVKAENLPGRTLHRVNVLNDGPRNLKGDGVNVGIWDEGEIVSHLDFMPTGRVTMLEFSSASQHSSHCAGTILGRGNINPFARGMAPNASLFSSNFSGNIQSEMAAAIPANNLAVSSHSYGGSVSSCSINGSQIVYSTTSRNTDLNLNQFPNHLHIHSAGNSQTSCSGGWYTITGSGKTAKNNILVAAVTSTDAMTSFSSFGPTQDGRVKPEISAFGNGVYSTSTPANSYATLSGTSMATPGVSGSVTLLVQRYRQLNGNADPRSTLIKNTVLNTAQDLGNAGPDYKFGYGRINALQAVRVLEENRYVVNNVANGNNNSFNITVPAGAARLRVMLTWNDPAGAANANPALVNNLDLTVTDGASNVTLPWILDPANPANTATRGVDNTGNVEQVQIDNPTAGTYAIKVTGTTVPSGPQEYAVTWSVDQPYIEVLYPNGGESFNPFSNEIITWDNAGVTGNQTVEYTLDNGATWNNIGTVGPSTTRLTWSVPTANTSQAKVRVTSGSLTDQSDANFKILATTTGFSGTGGGCAAGEITFTWTAVTNATHYDIYQMESTSGNFIVLASNVTGTTYTASGLTPGGNNWYTIVAKNNTTGAVSERANAINLTASSGGGGLGAVGAITGQNTICGTPSGVTYTIAAVSGATSYNWTVPPGAVLVSGQGGTAITVNYPAGSSSGNVSVTATNGSCNSAPSTMPITVGGANITAPLSGGDQSVTVCPGNPVPTLTATASVPTGYTVVWYTASTGGTVVASPTLNAAGTVTYYAASKDNTTNCESTNRTAVTLTITQVPAASITAGGSTTLCQGATVTLTANAGGSWLWSNGATTQAITVSTAGSYTVQVTTGSCVSTSPAVNVVVNPVPVASVSAGGPTTFCQGQSVVLTASAGSSWLWSNGATTQAITVSTSGNYSVTVTNASGCSATSAATAVTVNPNPPATVTAGGATTFCQGGSVTLTANSGNSYLWSNGATTQSITLNGPIGTTNYSVQVTQAGGCISSSTVTAVTVNPLPVAAITAGGPTTVCEPNSITLTASAGTAWLWSNGATTQSITLSSPSASGSYNVRVTNANGCSATSANTNITINPRPSVTLSASPYTRLFPGLSTTLTASVSPSGTYTYVWTQNGNIVTGATAATLPVTLSNLGTYAVTATNAGGCSNTSAQLVIADSITAKLFIMPNPNNGQFEISYYSAGANNYSVTITDAKGALVFNKAYAINAPYQRLAVDLRKNGAGVYMVFITDSRGKRLATGKVLITP